MSSIGGKISSLPTSCCLEKCPRSSNDLVDNVIIALEIMDPPWSSTVPTVFTLLSFTTLSGLSHDGIGTLEGGGPFGTGIGGFGGADFDAADFNASGGVSAGSTAWTGKPASTCGCSRVAGCVRHLIFELEALITASAQSINGRGSPEGLIGSYLRLGL